MRLFLLASIAAYLPFIKAVSQNQVLAPNRLAYFDTQACKAPNAQNAQNAHVDRANGSFSVNINKLGRDTTSVFQMSWYDVCDKFTELGQCLWFYSGNAEDEAAWAFLDGITAFPADYTHTNVDSDPAQFSAWNGEIAYKICKTSNTQDCMKRGSFQIESICSSSSHYKSIGSESLHHRFSVSAGSGYWTQFHSGQLADTVIHLADDTVINSDGIYTGFIGDTTLQITGNTGKLVYPELKIGAIDSVSSGGLEYSCTGGNWVGRFPHNTANSEIDVVVKALPYESPDQHYLNLKWFAVCTKLRAKQSGCAWLHTGEYDDWFFSETANAQCPTNEHGYAANVYAYYKNSVLQTPNSSWDLEGNIALEVCMTDPLSPSCQEDGVNAGCNVEIRRVCAGKEERPPTSAPTTKPLLDQVWEIEEPSVQLENNTVIMDFPLSDAISNDMIAFSTTDKNGNPVPVGYFKETTNADDVEGIGKAQRNIGLDIQIDPAAVVNDPNFYSEAVVDGQTIASIAFNVKLDVLVPGTANMIGNFMEIEVELYVDLTNDAGTDFTGIGAKNKNAFGDKIDYEVEAFLCDDNNEKMNSQLSLTQGQVIKVCVRPDGKARQEGIVMASIDSFTFQRGSLSQVAVVGKNSAPSGLSILTCNPGDTICWFETILRADFFAQSGIVTGNGVATMQFDSSARRLLRSDNTSLHRSLQGREGPTADFGLNFEVLTSSEPLWSTTSSGSNSRNHALVAIPLIAGYLYSLSLL